MPPSGSAVPGDEAAAPQPGPPANAAASPVAVDRGVADVSLTMNGERGRELGEARARLAAWASAAGFPSEVVEDIVLAGYEAMANAAEHAYGSGRRHVEVRATCARDGFAVVSVSDRGRWRPPPADPGFRGRGLVLIRAIADEVDIEHGDVGTSVHMRWRLPASRVS